MIFRFGEPLLSTFFVSFNENFIMNPHYDVVTSAAQSENRVHKHISGECLSSVFNQRALPISEANLGTISDDFRA